MASGDDSENARLRKRAEAALRKSEHALEEADLSPEQMRLLVHELRVHQIELEMQDEELRLAQLALEEARDRYLELYDYAPVAYFTVDKNGLITEANLTAVHLMGIERNSLLKQPFSRFVCKDDQDTYYFHFQQALKAKDRQTCEIKLVEKSGKELHAQLESVAAQDENGDSSQLRIVVSDITLRKRAEGDLIRSNEFLKKEMAQRIKAEKDRDRLFNLSIDMLSVAGFDGFFKQTNPAFTKTLGWSQEELLSKPWIEFVHPDDREKTEAARGQLVGGTTVYSFENRYTCKDGSYRWLSWNSFPLVEGNLIVSVARDVTERKRMEEEIIRSNQDLQHFAYAASHDLQEPLRNVANCLGMLEKKYKGNLDADADQYIGYAVESAVRMKVLILDLLAYSRIGTRGKALQPVDCEQLLAQTVKNLASAISEAGAALTHDPLPTISGDDAQLSQVFQNLIQNAIKFRKNEPPQIHVSAVKNEKVWVFSVKDNGIGVESQYLDRIFVMFRRLNNRSTYEGTGMGLAIVKKVVERHGGRVWAESEPGVGTTFYFTIPGKRM